MFPFIDLLGDGYSSFTYVNHVLITETNTLALTAILDYGQTPVPATFTPLLEAYQQSKSSGKKGLSFTAFAKKQVAIETNFQPQRSPSPWPLALFVLPFPFIFTSHPLPIFYSYLLLNRGEIESEKESEKEKGKKKGKKIQVS